MRALVLALVLAPALARAEPVAEDERWLTGELDLGGGYVHGIHVSRGLVGPSGGFGIFVTPKLAITARIAGFSTFGSGAVYLGNLGPNLQFWFGPKVWVGVGVGQSFITGCSNGCALRLLGNGYDARFGVALHDQPDVGLFSVAFELVSITSGRAAATAFSAVVNVQRF